MKKMLFFLAIAMIIIAGCSKSETGNDPPVNPPEDSISFTLSSTIVSPMPLPAYYLIHKHCVGVKLKQFNNNYFTIAFTINAPSGTRVFKGDTARMWLGKDMEIVPYLEVHRLDEPYFGGWSLPSSCISAKVAKTNVYSFTQGVVE